MKAPIRRNGKRNGKIAASQKLREEESFFTSKLIA
jgi:hypothetical protein